MAENETSPLAQIILNKKRVDIDDEKPSIRELLEATDRTPSNFDVFELENEGDVDGDEVDLDTVIDRTDSPETRFFRAVENERNVGWQ